MYCFVKGNDLNITNLKENLVAFAEISGFRVKDVEVAKVEDGFAFSPLNERNGRIEMECPDLDSTKDLKLITNDPLFEYLDISFDDDVDVVRKWGAYFCGAFSDSENIGIFNQTIDNIASECNYRRNIGFNTIMSPIDPLFDDERVDEGILYDIIENFSEFWNFKSTRISLDDNPLNFIVLMRMNKRIEIPFLPTYSYQIEGREILQPGKILERNVPNCNKLYNDWFRDKVTDILTGNLFFTDVDGSWNNSSLIYLPALQAIGKWVYNNLFNMSISYRTIELRDDLTFRAQFFTLDEFFKLQSDIEEHWKTHNKISFRIEKPFIEVRLRIQDELGAPVTIVEFNNNFWIVPISPTLKSGQIDAIQSIINDVEDGPLAGNDRGFLEILDEDSFDGTEVFLEDMYEITTRSEQKIRTGDANWREKLTPYAIEYYKLTGSYPTIPQLLFQH